MKLIKLKSVATILTGFPFKGNLYSVEGTRVVRGENVTEGKLRWDTIKCWNQPFEKMKFYSLKNDDIVIGMDGSKVGKNKARIKKDALPLLLAQRVACVRSNDSSNQVYLFYCINNSRFEDYVFRIQTGSSVPHISKDQIEEFEIPFHSLKDQTQIAKVLSDLDSKIELNNKINAELEAMAKLIYDYWFVQFDFPTSAAYAASVGKPNLEGKPYKTSGGKMVWSAELKREIPEGWEVVALQQFGDLITGKTPSVNYPEHFGNASPFYTPVDFRGVEKIKISAERGVSNEGLKALSSYVIPKNSVMVTCIGSDMGKVSICDQEGLTNQQINSIKPFDSSCTEYLYQSISSIIPFLKVLGKSGSTVPIVNKSTLGSIQLTKPPANVLKSYSSTIKHSNELISNNLEQNQKLSELRDWLLPMLMNGQVKVGVVEERLAMAAEPITKYSRKN